METALFEIMQNNSRKNRLQRPRSYSSRYRGETKEIVSVHSRNVPYRVGYNWNKGGRLTELRIRNLARKFLKIWMQNTFGRILPFKAKSHYNSVVLRRTFAGWIEEWWMSRREWSLTLRAKCHYRYYLYHLAFHRWRMFVSLQGEKKSKIQKAQSFADRQQLCQALNRWGEFTEMRRMKTRMLESALEQNKLTTLHSAWSLWKARLQQHRDIHTLEDQALKHRALNLQRRAWLQWKGLHTTACCGREKESKASLHSTIRLKRKTLQHWMSYVSSCQTKKKSQAVANRAGYLHLMRVCWRRWSSALHDKRSEEERLQAAGHLATRNSQRRALQKWRAYVTLRREKAQRSRTASRHHNHHLQCAALQGLSLNVIWNKARRLNNNMAVQHCQQTMMSKYWRLWLDRLKEAEDKSFQPLSEMALTNYSTSLLSSCFYHWREKLAEQRHTQELERRADIWFAERMLPHYFNSWVAFTLQRRLNKQRKLRAEVYNQQRLYSWMFYTWRGRSEKHKEEMLSERMVRREETTAAVLQRHQQREALNRAQASLNQVLLLRCFTQWRKETTEARRERMSMEKARKHHDSKLLSKALGAWNKHHYQCLKYKVIRRRGILLLRLKICQTYFEQWRMKLQHRRRESKQTERALWHWSLTLQAKVLCGWRLWVTEHRRKQEQAARAALVYRDQLLREGVTCILTYAAHMNDLTTSLTHNRQEQRSENIQRVVKRCAMRWRQRALCKPSVQEVKGQPLKKKVTFCLPGLKNVTSSDSGEKEAEDGVLSKMLPTYMPRRQPRRCQELFESPLKVLSHNSSHTFTETAPQPSELSLPSAATILVTSTYKRNIIPALSISEVPMSVLDSHQTTQNQNLLLPPSAFMSTETQKTSLTSTELGKTSGSSLRDVPVLVASPLKETSSTHPEIHGRASSGEPEGEEPTSSLTRELLSIQLDMKSFQQDRRQLKIWQRLKEVLQSWLETSGKDEQMERNTVCQELKELDERIQGLSTELAARRPKMLLHAERIQHLQTVLHTLGVPAL